MEDAANTSGIDGFCASIRAFERKYRNGERQGGACW